jgi:hypothetical protein
VAVWLRFSVQDKRVRPLLVWNASVQSHWTTVIGNSDLYAVAQTARQRRRNKTLAARILPLLPSKPKEKAKKKARVEEQQQQEQGPADEERGLKEATKLLVSAMSRRPWRRFEGALMRVTPKHKPNVQPRVHNGGYSEGGADAEAESAGPPPRKGAGRPLGSKIATKRQRAGSGDEAAAADADEEPLLLAKKKAKARDALLDTKAHATAERVKERQRSKDQQRREKIALQVGIVGGC